MNNGSFRMLRWGTLLTALGILLPWYALTLAGFSSGGLDWVSLLFPILIPLWLPHLLLFFDLRRDLSEIQKKQTIGNCIAWGLFFFALSVLAIVVTNPSAPWMAYLATIALIQCVVVLGSIRAYTDLERSKHDWRMLTWRLLLSMVGISICALGIPPMPRDRSAHYEASSVGSLRTIYSAQDIYAHAHPLQGYATTLKQLGPNGGADLIDGVLAAGEKSGYKFDLSPRTDPSGRVVGYVVTAHPKSRGIRSFTTDETGTVYYTAEDRVATSKGPKLE